MTTRSEMIDRIRMRRDALWLAGRDPQGVAPTTPEESSTWVVTQVEPTLMGMPATGGHAVSVEATDAVKGVRVGHRIRVEVRGMGSRVAVALLDVLPIKARDNGDPVATINGKTVTVGGSTVLSADDVGALPGDTTLADLGYTGVPSHTHSVGSTNCTVTLPSVSPSWFTSNLSDPQATINSDFDVKLNRLLTAVNALSGASRSCAGCGASGNTSSSGGGGGTPTPTNPGARSVVVNVSDPIWWEPTSPETWSWTWGSDILTLARRAASTLHSLSGRNLSVTGGGSVTLRTIGSIDTSDPVPWEQYSQVWGDQMRGMISQAYDAHNTIVGAYSVSGGGSVTIGSTLANPLASYSPPLSYSQPVGATYRLAVVRLLGALGAMCGASFPVN